MFGPYELAFLSDYIYFWHPIWYVLNQILGTALLVALTIHLGTKPLMSVLLLMTNSVLSILLSGSIIYRITIEI